jgi:Protein of unknown function (DUF1269)
MRPERQLSNPTPVAEGFWVISGLRPLRSRAEGARLCTRCRGASVDAARAVTLGGRLGSPTGATECGKHEPEPQALRKSVERAASVCLPMSTQGSGEGEGMSDLIVIGYDDEMTAETVLDDLLEMEREYLVDLKDAAVVFRDVDGHLHVHTRHNDLGPQTLTGMFWGFVIGLIFLVPLAGVALGGLVGFVAGTVGDLGMKQDFKDDAGSLAHMAARCSEAR